MIKIMQISDQLFWGFNITVNLNNYKTFEELTAIILRELIDFLKSHNLLNLVDLAKDLKLHCHMYEKYEDLYKTDAQIIYLCGGGCL